MKKVLGTISNLIGYIFLIVGVGYILDPFLNPHPSYDFRQYQYGLIPLGVITTMLGMFFVFLYILTKKKGHRIVYFLQAIFFAVLLESIVETIFYIQNSVFTINFILTLVVLAASGIGYYITFRKIIILKQIKENVE